MARKKKRSRSRSRSGGFKKKGSRKSNKRSFFPIDMNTSLVDFSAGAVVGPLSEKLRPLQQRYLGNFGPYSDEVALAIASTVGYKYGGKLHPMVKKVSKELFRISVINTGAGVGSDFVRSALNRIPQLNSPADSTNSGNLW